MPGSLPSLLSQSHWVLLRHPHGLWIFQVWSFGAASLGYEMSFVPFAESPVPSAPPHPPRPMSPLCASRLNSAIANPPPVFPGSPAGCICTHHLPAHSLALSLLPAPSSAVPGPILLCCTSLSLHVLAWLTETSSPGLRRCRRMEQ